jgi:hypothetical protein
MMSFNKSQEGFGQVAAVATLASNGGGSLPWLLYGEPLGQGKPAMSPEGVVPRAQTPLDPPQVPAMDRGVPEILNFSMVPGEAACSWFHGLWVKWTWLMYLWMVTAKS